MGYNNEPCPVCGQEMDGMECQSCGFADQLDYNEYESPNGTIVHCSEVMAFELGYIHICPSCCFNVVKFWEMDDHGMCIDCWHMKRNSSLTSHVKHDII